MKPLVERHGNWSVALSEVPDSATFEASSWRYATAPSDGLAASRVEVSLCVEVLQFGGGLTPRALVGGTFVSGGDKVVIEVGSTGLITLDAARECRSLLGGPLVSGLPAEFVDAVLEGVLAITAEVAPPAGTLRIQAGGYDEMDSSAYAFRHAAAALVWAINTHLRTSGAFGEGLAGLVEAW